MSLPVSGFSRAIFKCRDEKVSFAVRSGTTIGRADDANIILDINENISRKHAVLRMKAGEGYIQDISEKAGVYLNGKKITDRGYNAVIKS